MDSNYIDSFLVMVRERSAALSDFSSYKSPVLAPLAAIGLLYVSYRLFTFMRLFFSIFALPGKPVSFCTWCLAAPGGRLLLAVLLADASAYSA